MTDPFRPEPPQAPPLPPSYPESGSTGAEQAPQPGAPAYGAPPPMSHGGHGGHGAAAPGAPSTTGMPTGQTYAGFFARAVATVVDSIILTLVAVPFVVLALTQWETRTDSCTRANGTIYTCEVPTDRFIGIAIALAGLWALVALSMTFFYFIRPIAKKGNTIGGRLMGLQVVSVHTGAPPSLGRSALRYLMRTFGSSQFLGIGYWWMLWDKQNQTLHDKVGETVVVRRRG